MKAAGKKQGKKIALLGLLLVILAGILTWQWMHREKPVEPVKNETEHRALACFMEMLEAGRRNGWNRTAEYWNELPDRKKQTEYQKLFGKGFRSEFIFQGSANVEDSPEQLILYGMFDSSGAPLEILMTDSSGSFKIIAIKEL